jgi:hypothetical protein
MQRVVGKIDGWRQQRSVAAPGRTRRQMLVAEAERCVLRAIGVPVPLDVI